MASVIGNIGAIWQRMTLVQRVTLLAVVLACGGACVFLFNWAREPDMTLLYGGLAPEDASKVADKIRESKTPFEVRGGGTAIYVPSEKVASLKMELAGAGLPRGDNGGYKILDDEKIGISPFSQRVNYMRAIEGELARTICVLDGVASARVHIVRPEEVLFGAKKSDSSATIVLRVKPGWRLTPGNVAAVIHLLSGSVEGLSPQKVVVVDAQGNLLSNQTDNQFAAAGNTLLDYKSRVEQYLSGKAEEMLSAALGPNRASVRVDATIETTSTESTIESYTVADSKGLAREQTRTSTPTPGATGEVAAAKENENTVEYLAPPKTVERKIDMPGKVKSLTVAAFVDLSSPMQGAVSGTGAAAAPKMTIKDAEEVIRSAIGLAATDTLKVVDTPFYRPAQANEADPAEQAHATRSFYLDIAQRGSMGVLVVGALLALRMFRAPKGKGAGAGVAALEAGGAQLALSAGGNENPDMLRARITRALQDNPEEVKRLFLNWVQTEKSEV